LSASPTWARAELFPEEHYILNRPSSTGTPEGPIIEIAGRVIDGNGDPVPDAMVEIWQANAAGRYASPDDTREDCALDPHFVGFGRAATSAEGIYHFRTIRPGRVLGPGNRLQAPHVALSIFGRGLVKRLATRIYFADSEDNDVDAMPSRVPIERRDTLIARSGDNGVWWLDIVLQGLRETVFFDL
jgi:protocatechuate 3,4-dioxygenase alpha subunit